MHLLQSYYDPDRKEFLYSCIFALVDQRSYLLTAGQAGIIRMIDLKMQGHAKKFIGHGHAINELQAGRWNFGNVRTEICVGVITVTSE